MNRNSFVIIAIAIGHHIHLVPFGLVLATAAFVAIVGIAVKFYCYMAFQNKYLPQFLLMCILVVVDDTFVVAFGDDLSPNHPSVHHRIAIIRRDYLIDLKEADHAFHSLHHLETVAPLHSFLI